MQETNVLENYFYLGKIILITMNKLTYTKSANKFRK